MNINSVLKILFLHKNNKWYPIIIWRLFASSLNKITKIKLDYVYVSAACNKKDFLTHNVYRLAVWTPIKLFIDITMQAMHDTGIISFFSTM